MIAETSVHGRLAYLFILYSFFQRLQCLRFPNESFNALRTGVLLPAFFTYAVRT